MAYFQVKGLGWRKDRTDHRDYTPRKAAEKAGIDKEASSSSVTPAVVDNRRFCAFIKDQENLGSCTAFAYTSMYEFINKRNRSKFTELSPLFEYKLTRFLMGEEGIGDSGAYIRTAIQAGIVYGSVPEEFHRYTDLDPEFDREPSSGAYGLAQQYQPTLYFRLDKSNNPTAKLENIKAYIAKGYPVQFGFNVYGSYTQTGSNGGMFPFPSDNDDLVGGHSVIIVGYDTNKQVPNKTGGNTTTGAFLIQNSWGTNWGYGGFGWLPFEYLLEDLADDFWSITAAEFMDPDQFAF